MIEINEKKCDGCKKYNTSQCVEVCPGNLLYLNEKAKAACYDVSECWDCFACVKACPRLAISIQLPFQLNESLAQLVAFHRRDKTVWLIRDPNGKVIKRFIITTLVKSPTNLTTSDEHSSAMVKTPKY